MFTFAPPPHPPVHSFKGLKAINERQGDGVGILHQAAQFPIDQVYLIAIPATVGLPVGMSGTIAMIEVLAGCSITHCRTCELYF